ncbi:MAG: hypothetical protein KDA25_11840, partial [Phycisphaerales bacterium]|nr:hypothetical protein [Phycisphaerales bacterium]
MSRIRPLPLILTAATVFAFGAAADADVYTYRVVSRTGDAAPGTLGGTFTSFGYPSLNEKGTVGFAASTTAVLGQSGIWMTEPDDPQSVQLVAGTNYIPPGSPASIRFGTFGFSFHHAILTDDDTIGFSAPLTGLPVGDGTGTGLFRRSTGGMLETVLRPGQPAPGLGGGAIVDWISNLPTMNAYGRFAFSAALSGAGITPANDSAVYTHWFGGLTMLAR